MDYESRIKRLEVELEHLLTMRKLEAAQADLANTLTRQANLMAKQALDLQQSQAQRIDALEAKVDRLWRDGGGAA
jgi:hypothetical protein